MTRYQPFVRGQLPVNGLCSVRTQRADIHTGQHGAFQVHTLRRHTGRLQNFSFAHASASVSLGVISVFFAASFIVRLRGWSAFCPTAPQMRPPKAIRAEATKSHQYLRCDDAQTLTTPAPAGARRIALRSASRASNGNERCCQNGASLLSDCSEAPRSVYLPLGTRTHLDPFLTDLCIVGRRVARPSAKNAFVQPSAVLSFPACAVVHARRNSVRRSLCMLRGWSTFGTRSIAHACMRAAGRWMSLGAAVPVGVALSCRYAAPGMRTRAKPDAAAGRALVSFFTIDGCRTEPLKSLRSSFFY